MSGRHFLGSFVGSCIVLAVAGPAALAQPSIKVTVVAVLATERNSEVAPCLECLAREIKKVEPNLSGFRVARVTQLPLQLQQEEKFPLVEKKEAVVTVLEAADKDGWVSLEVKTPKLGVIVYRSKCGKFFPIVTRYLTKDGARLIVAIRVSPCPHALGGCRLPSECPGVLEEDCRTPTGSGPEGIRRRPRRLPVTSPAEAVIIFKA